MNRIIVLTEDGGIVGFVIFLAWFFGIFEVWIERPVNRLSRARPLLAKVSFEL